MFTGLIEEWGTVATVQHRAEGSTLSITAREVLEGIALGDSIAIDGACTTVVRFDSRSFTIEASPETLSKTTFGALTAGTPVNLERPLTPTSRIGGHYVTGHVDGLAKLVSATPEGISTVMTFELDSDELARGVVPKGSIAISGISLTVNTVMGRRFTVAIIPHTLAKTNLGERRVGDRVNIETDLLGKYVQQFLAPAFSESIGNVSRLNTEILAEHGFLPSHPAGGQH